MCTLIHLQDLIISGIIYLANKGHRGEIYGGFSIGVILMPRVATKKKQYNSADFCAWIYAKLKVSRRTLGELADVIGCTRKTLYNKMSSQKADFDYQELMEIFKFCNASDEEILRFMKI